MLVLMTRIDWDEGVAEDTTISLTIGEGAKKAGALRFSLRLHLDALCGVDMGM
jgi:hypothetical protein